jgi:hypothetical protein
VQQLCREAEEVARRVVTQSQDVERRIGEHASVTSAVLDSQARKQEEVFGEHHERIHAASGAAQQQLSETAASAQSALEVRLSERVESARSQVQRYIEEAITRLEQSAAQATRQNTEEWTNAMRQRLGEELQSSVSELRSSAEAAAVATEQRIQSGALALNEELRREFREHSSRMDGSFTRAAETAAQLEQRAELVGQMSAQLGTTQQLALEAFQSQLDDVLTLHRNELHRRSEMLFDDLNKRVRHSFEEASRDAVSRFDQQVRSMAEPHIAQTNEAISRMAGGRSLLDASLSLQQDRIRNAADEAFAESLARFRENLGGIEELLHEASQSVIDRNLSELNGKAGDIRHRTSEEIYKTAEWYEKKTQTQLNGLTDRMVEQGGQKLRERAGEVAAEFTAELDHSSRNFVGHAQTQMKEAVRESFDQARAPRAGRIYRSHRPGGGRIEPAICRFARTAGFGGDRGAGEFPEKVSRRDVRGPGERRARSAGKNQRRFCALVGVLEGHERKRAAGIARQNCRTEQRRDRGVQVPAGQCFKYLAAGDGCQT